MRMPKPEGAKSSRVSELVITRLTEIQSAIHSIRKKGANREANGSVYISDLCGQ
jgi:hypothetical protein